MICDCFIMVVRSLSRLLSLWCVRICSPLPSRAHLWRNDVSLVIGVAFITQESHPHRPMFTGISKHHCLRVLSLVFWSKKMSFIATKDPVAAQIRVAMSKLSSRTDIRPVVSDIVVLSMGLLSCSEPGCTYLWSLTSWRLLIHRFIKRWRGRRIERERDQGNSIATSLLRSMERLPCPFFLHYPNVRLHLTITTTNGGGTGTRAYFFTSSHEL